MKKAIVLLPLGCLGFLTGCNNQPEPIAQYTVTFKNDDGSVLQQTLVDEGSYPVYEGETPQKTCEVDAHEYVYTGWDKDLAKVTQDVTYVATYDYVFLYGFYPQTLVSDKNLINQLNDTSVSGDYGYKTLNGKQYFEYISQWSYKADDGTAVKEGDSKYKYYEVQPIQWKILTEEEGTNKAFYTTYKLLIAKRYGVLTELTDDNRYDKSEITEWLNEATAPQSGKKTDVGGFYWRALSSVTDRQVATVGVDNRWPTTCDTNNRYATNDPMNAKVFLLSRLNLHNQGDGNYASETYKFGEDDLIDKERLAVTTDFARATGAGIGFNNYGIYWTRSPSDCYWAVHDNDAYCVMTDGHIIQHTIDDGRYCARPCIRFE